MEKIDPSNKRELVEKLREEYFTIQNKKKTTAKILLYIGIGLLVCGIILAINGFASMFDDHGIGWLGSYLGGIFMALAGFLMTLFNVVRLNTLNRAGESDLVPFIQTRLREIELRDTNKLLAAVDGKEPQTKCEYCGFVINVSDRVCSHCGANLF